MRLEDYRVVFVVVGLVGVLIFASPALGLVVRLPVGERFSELWVLGPGHLAEGYPFDVRVGGSYSVYVGVGDFMGGAEFYLVEVKFRNSTDSLPNGTVSSDLPALYKYRVFLGDGGVWESLVSFSFGDVVFGGNSCRVGVFSVNGVDFRVDKTADLGVDGYYFQVLVELWLYDKAADGFSYNGRFVSLWLNMTASA